MKLGEFFLREAVVLRIFWVVRNEFTFRKVSRGQRGLGEIVTVALEPRNGYDLASPNLQAYMKQWTKAQEVDGFALGKPSRWKYFRHLLEYPLFYGKIMSPRHRLYSYIRAFGALALGYERLYLLDDLRKGFKSILGKPAQESVLSEDKKQAAAKN